MLTTYGIMHADGKLWSQLNIWRGQVETVGSTNLSFGHRIDLILDSWRPYVISLWSLPRGGMPLRKMQVDCLTNGKYQGNFPFLHIFLEILAIHV